MPPGSNISARAVASCLDETPIDMPLRRVRLAVLTFASRDLLMQCRLFMHYYLQVERIPSVDMHVLLHEANGELRSCFDQLPRSNIIDTAPRNHRLGNSSGGSRYREAHRSHALMAMQRKLLAGVYSHTLIADLDEFVMAEPERYGSLRDYLRHNPHRRTAAPSHAYEVQVIEEEEGALNWTATPLLRGQRSVMVPVCGMRKAILSRVPSHFTFSTHNMKLPTFFACAPNKWGSAADCLDDALWLVHTKCVDLALPLANTALLADKDRGGGDPSAVAAFLRRRCGHASAWRKK